MGQRKAALPGAPVLPAEAFAPPGEALLPGDRVSAGHAVPKVSSSPRFEENTKSREGSFSMHSTLDTGKQLNLIWEGCSADGQTEEKGSRLDKFTKDPQNYISLSVHRHQLADT